MYRLRSPHTFHVLSSNINFRRSSSSHNLKILCNSSPITAERNTSWSVFGNKLNTLPIFLPITASHKSSDISVLGNRRNALLISLSIYSLRNSAISGTSGYNISNLSNSSCIFNNLFVSNFHEEIFVTYLFDS